MKSQLVAFASAVSFSLATSIAMANDFVDLIVDESLVVTFATASGATSTQYLPNTSEALFLPCDVVDVYGEIIMERSGFDGDIYPRIVERLFDSDGVEMWSRGYSGINRFNEVVFDSPDVLDKNVPTTMTFVALDATSADRDWIFQVSDLPSREYVRLNITVMGFDSPWFKDLVEDSNPDDNSLDLWVMRCCY